MYDVVYEDSDEASSGLGSVFSWCRLMAPFLVRLLTGGLPFCTPQSTRQRHKLNLVLLELKTKEN